MPVGQASRLSSDLPTPSDSALAAQPVKPADATARSSAGSKRGSFPAATGSLMTGRMPVLLW